MGRKTAFIIGRIFGLILVVVFAFGVTWCATHWPTVKAETSKLWGKLTGDIQQSEPINPTPDGPTIEIPDDPTPDNPHAHLWSEWTTTVASTCLSSGQQQRTCECGEKQTQTIPALGHVDGEWETTTEATCTTDGLKTKKCLTCGETLDTQAIPVIDHTFGDWAMTTESTCTTVGQKERSCSCGEKQTQTIPALGHNHIFGACSRCGNELPNNAELDITASSGKEMKLQGLKGMTFIDWGDGTRDGSVSHTYESSGNYTIGIGGVTEFSSCVFNIFLAYSAGGSKYLKAIRISENVTSISSSAFSGFSSRESVQVDSNNAVYKSEGNCLLTKNGKTLILGFNDSIIPESVTSIGFSAFRHCKSLTSISIPEGVTEIGDCAFYQCSGLTSINIPEGVSKVGQQILWLRQFDLNLNPRRSDHNWIRCVL